MEQNTTEVPEVPEIQEEVQEISEIQEVPEVPELKLEEISLNDIQEQKPIQELEEIKATPYINGCSTNTARIVTLTGLWLGLCIAAAFI